MRRQDGELDSGGSDDLERLAVHRGFRKPETDRIAAEPLLEIGDAPTDLSLFVAAAGERKDDVVKRHRQRVAVADALHAGAIGPQDCVVDLRGFALHPVEQRRAKVEAQVLVDRDPGFLPALLDIHGNERQVRLFRDPGIPVVLGRGRGLGVDLAGPRIFSWWLIKVPVDDDETLLRSHPTTSAMLRRMLGKRLSCASSASTRCIVGSSILPLASA